MSSLLSLFQLLFQTNSRPVYSVIVKYQQIYLIIMTELITHRRFLKAEKGEIHGKESGITRPE